MPLRRPSNRTQRRHVVWMPGEPVPGALDGCLAPARNGLVSGGGHRTLHELAVAIAATGRRVEVRGPFDFAELSTLAGAAGAMPEWPTEPLDPDRGDVIIFPEGGVDPLLFAPALFSPARCIIVLLAPPGLFGWPFTEDWVPRSAADVPLEFLARPEHFRAMSASGLELWTHMHLVRQKSLAAGVECTYIGNGRPYAYPIGQPRSYDVAFLAGNRWSESSRQVIERLGSNVTWLEIPPSANGRVLELIGQARILIHPGRVEGHSRVAQEARGTGTVPLTLASNEYATGSAEGDGGVRVQSLDEMPGVVHALLNDPARLESLSAAATRSAAQQVRWDLYLERIDAALERDGAPDHGRGARTRWGERIREELRERENTLDAARARADAAELAAAQLEQELNELRGEREALVLGARELTGELETERHERQREQGELQRQLAELHAGREEAERRAEAHARALQDAQRALEDERLALQDERRAREVMAATRAWRWACHYRRVRDLLRMLIKR